MEPSKISIDTPELNINEQMALNHIKNIKIDKSPGPNNLHPRLQFKLKVTISKPLSINFKTITINIIGSEGLEVRPNKSNLQKGQQSTSQKLQTRISNINKCVKQWRK